MVAQSKIFSFIISSLRSFIYMLGFFFISLTLPRNGSCKYIKDKFTEVFFEIFNKFHETLFALEWNYWAKGISNLFSNLIFLKGKGLRSIDNHKR